MKIACLIPGGLGGTQKAGWLFAEGLVRLGHEVSGWSEEGAFVPASPGPRLNVVKIRNELDSFVAIAEGQFDALHVHMPGYYIRHPLYPFLKRLGKKRPRVVETNIFGWLQDWRANPVTDYRLFISMTSAWQAANRGGKEVFSLENCGVARYPVSPIPVSSGEDRRKVRLEMGFDENDVVALRLGRPDAAKWTDLECRAAMQIRQEGGKKLKLLVIEPPGELHKNILSGDYGDGIVVRNMELNPARVAEIQDASDIILHAARFGESFGYAIAEGMSVGKPVITKTTPWGDNAQIELVEHGVTGLVACSVEGLTQALRLLVADRSLRNTMGAAGRERILRISDSERECEIVHAALIEDQKVLFRRRSELLEFSATLPQREWNVIEKTHGSHFDDAPAILNREMGCAYRYLVKKRLSALRADLRSLIGRPAYV